MYMFYLYHVYSGCIRFVTNPEGAKRPRASRQIRYTPDRHDTNGLYPESAWSTYSNFYCNHRYSNTFSLVYLLEYLYAGEVEESSYAMNEPEDDFEPPNKLRKH